MAGSFRSILVVAVALLLRLCGGDAPDAVVLEFALDYEGAEAEGRISPEDDRGAIHDEMVSVVVQRLVGLGVAFRWDPVGSSGFRIYLRDASQDTLESVVEVVTSPGELAFRITVRPREEYRGFPPGRTPARLSDPDLLPWRKSADAFYAFKKRELERWRAAEAGKIPYRPSRPDYRICLRTSRDGVGLDDFEIVEEPLSTVNRFGGRILLDAFIGDGPDGMPVVYFNVKEEHQIAFGEWTERNVGLPIAIILNDRIISDPVVQGKLTDRVVITLRRGKERAELRAEAEHIAAVLRAGAVRVRPRLVSVRRRGE